MSSGQPHVDPVAGASSDAQDRSLGDVVSDIATDLSTLVKQEMELARTELKQEAAKAGKGAGMLGDPGSVVPPCLCCLYDPERLREVVERRQLDEPLGPSAALQPGVERRAGVGFDGGEQGVAEVLELLRAELELGLKLLGCTSPADVTRAHVRRAHL